MENKIVSFEQFVGRIALDDDNEVDDFIINNFIEINDLKKIMNKINNEMFVIFLENYFWILFAYFNKIIDKEEYNEAKANVTLFLKNTILTRKVLNKIKKDARSCLINSDLEQLYNLLIMFYNTDDVFHNRDLLYNDFLTLWSCMGSYINVQLPCRNTSINNENIRLKNLIKEK